MEINFKNGSSIRTIKNNNNNSDRTLQITGIDLTNEDSKDYSCVSYKCGSCNTVFKTEMYDKNTEVTLYGACPICGRRFKGWINVN